MRFMLFIKQTRIHDKVSPPEKANAILWIYFDGKFFIPSKHQAENLYMEMRVARFIKIKQKIYDHNRKSKSTIEIQD